MVPLLQLLGIHKRFGPTIALAGVDLDVQKGEVHAIIGENGAGKSTLVNVLSGTIRPDAGDISLNGAPYHPLSPFDARRVGIAYIHQELSLCPHLSVAENILLGAEPASTGWLDRPAMLKQTRTLLTSFGRADIDPQTRVSNLGSIRNGAIAGGGFCRSVPIKALFILCENNLLCNVVSVCLKA